MANEPVVGDRLGKQDFVYATAAGLLFTLIYLVFSPRGMDPAVWGDFAVAAGLHPPKEIFPAIWRFVAAGNVWLFGPIGAGRALKVLGAVVGGGCVAMISLLLRQTLAYLMRVKNRQQWQWIAPLVTMVCTVMLATSDAMWRMVAPLTAGAIDFLIFLLAIQIFLSWIRRGGLNWLLLAEFVAGFLSAETLLGFLLPLFYYVTLRLLLAAGANGKVQLEQVLLDVDHPLPKWRMFFCFLAGLLVAMGANITNFVMFDGLAANNWYALDIFFQYVLGYHNSFVAAASLGGWAFFFGLSVLPLIAAFELFPRLCQDSEPLNFKLGLILFFVGVAVLIHGAVLPFCRLAGLAATPFNIESDLLLGLFSLCTVLTLCLVATCFTNASQYLFMYDPEEDRVVPVELRGWFMRVLVPGLLMVCVLPSVLRIYRPAESELRAIVNDALTETIRECGDAKFLFTDGRLDAGLELKALQMESSVRPLNLMGGISEWEKTMRTRHFQEGTADFISASQGVPVLMRVWAGEQTNGMDQAATQVGFEFWRRARKSPPRQSGMVARTRGIDDNEQKYGVAFATSLANRIMYVMRNYPSAISAVSPELRDAVFSVSWRLSRFARMRDDVELANALDELNSTVKHMMKLIEYERMRTFMQLTPYEGLRLALHRADFAEARRYAATVLQIDENDPEANFGTGMAYLMEDKLKEAEIYLERILKARPEEPAVLNNLSIIYRKTNRLEKALEYVKKAHELLPENEEIVRTLRDTERVIRSRSETIQKVFTK